MDAPDQENPSLLTQIFIQMPFVIMQAKGSSLIKQMALKCLLLLIKGYQWILSPVLGNHCRFHPSCSHYCHDALIEHGIFTGLFLGLKRILRCHPGNPGGIDPVPKKSTHNG